MNDVHTIFINVVSNIIWFPISALVGGLIVSLVYFVRVRLPKRRLWKLTNHKNLVACVSNTPITDTGVYYRPATGIGELRALFLVVESLSRAYTRDLDIKNILLASDQRLQERLENDLLLIGGPNHNWVTAEYLKLVDDKQPDKQPFQQTSDAFIWKCKKAGKWVDNGSVTYTSKVENKNIIQDFGIVVRVKSPFTPKKRTVILLSGIHTYGTIAAAKYFTEDMQKGWRWFLRLRKRNIVVLVRTRIIDDYTADLEMIKYASW